MDIARLGLQIDSSQVEKGTVSLQQLSGAANQASTSSQRLASASQAEAIGQKAATTATQLHTAALGAQNTIIRSSMQQRTMMIYQLNDVGVSLASGMNPMMVAIQQGSQILQGGFAPALRTITDLTVGLIAKFWPLMAVVGLVAGAFSGLAYEFNKAGETQVSMIDVAIAGWQMFAETVTNLVAPVFSAIGGWLAAGWNAAAPVLKTAGNAIIGAFVGAFEAVKATWSLLPGAIGDLVVQAANGVVGTVEGMINKVSENINGFIANINGAIMMIPENLRGGWTGIGEISPVNLGRIANPNEGAAAGAGDAASGAFAGAQRDYLGGIGVDWEARAEQIALARVEIEELDGAAAAASESLKAANDNIWGMTDALGELGPASVDPLTMLRTQMSDLDGLLAQGKISWEEYGEAAFRANAGAASSVMGLASGMTGALAQMFQDNKAFAIANAVVSTAESVMKALATYGPTPWGFAAAGIAAATGAAQIGAILSASPGSGSVSAPSGAGAGKVENAAQREAAPAVTPSMNITVQGLDRNKLYDGDTIERFIQSIESASGDGRILNIKVA